MRVLIAGANGFIGKLITRHLAIRLPDVRVMRLVRDGVGYNVTEADCADLARTLSLTDAVAMSEPDIVINAAGLINGTPAELFSANAVFPTVLVNALSQSPKPVRLIQIGSAAEYGLPQRSIPFREDDCCRPVSLYGISKLAGAQATLVHDYTRSLSVVHLRLFNIVSKVNSPNQVLGAFAERVRSFGGCFEGQVIKLGNLGAVRDFVDAQDFLDVITRLIDGAAAPSILNIASASGLSVRAVIHSINDALPVPFTIEETDFRSAANTSNTAILGDAAALTAFLGRPMSPINPVLEAIAQQLTSTSE